MTANTNEIHAFAEETKHAVPVDTAKQALNEPSPQAEHLTLLSFSDLPPAATLRFPATIGDFKKLKKAGSDQ